MKPSRDDQVATLSQYLIECLQTKELTIEEFAALSGVSSSTIRRIIKNDEVESKFRYSTIIKVQDCIIKLNNQPTYKSDSIESSETPRTFLIIMFIILVFLVFAIIK